MHALRTPIFSCCTFGSFFSLALIIEVASADNIASALNRWNGKASTQWKAPTVMTSSDCWKIIDHPEFPSSIMLNNVADRFI